MNRLTLVVALIGVACLLALPLTVTLFLASAGGALSGGGCAGDGGTGGGSQQIGDRNWSAEQTANAQTIVAATLDRGLPRRAAVIATSVAIVEADLLNVGFGHADSLGLFQQRESQGWGPPAVTMNPARAAGAFLDALARLPDWPQLPPGEAAIRVQRPAPEFEGRYAPQEPVAAQLVARFWVGPDVPTPPPPGGGDPGQVAPVSAATLACPDQGESNLPVGPDGLDAEQLPPGFTLPTDPRQRAAVTFALAQLPDPYVFGAKGPDAFDCSGLTQGAWAAAGVPISAGTIGQVRDGEPVPSLGLIAPGDLLFIPGSLGTRSVPRHVGLYAGNGVVVAAHSSARGIILQPITDWAPQVVAIRRIIPDAAPESLAAGAPS